jgi:hypothetical protein
MENAADKYKNSVHGRAYRYGKLHAAGCVDCHGSHGIFRGDNPRSNVHRSNIFNRCQICHKTIVDRYKASVHGQAVQNENPDAPVCTVCHEEHTIASTKTPESPVYKTRLATDTCGRCHANVELASTYGFPADRLETYHATFHGLKNQAGSVQAANCASCHGVHTILPSSDPASRIHSDNLAATCGQCHHTDKTQVFAAIQVHQTPLASGAVAQGEKLLYQWLMPFLLIALLALYVVRYVPAVWKGMESLSLGRLAFLVVNPLILLVLLAVVIGTGLAFRYHGAWWLDSFPPFAFSEGIRSVLHKLFSILFILSLLAQIGYAVWKRQSFLMILGIIVCAFIVVASGILLWFPFYFINLLSASALEAAKALHWFGLWFTILCAFLLMWFSARRVAGLGYEDYD